MRIWIVKDMEPLPIDPGGRRLLRGGMLCKVLVGRGHEVTWFASSFDHYKKQQRTRQHETHRITDRYRIELLYAPGYRRNTSPARVWHNRRFARAFVEFAEQAKQRPDVLVTDLPTTETAEAVVRFGHRKDLPTLLSIRDLWPDFFADFLPGMARPWLRFILAGFERQAAYACRNTTALIGISPRYLEWGLAKGKRERRDLDAVVPLGYAPVWASAEAGARDGLAELQRLGIDGQKRLVSFVGSWGATYDLDLVVEAARRLQGMRDIQFVLAGDGDNRKRLQNQLRRQANIVAPGWLNAAEIAVLLEQSTLGLMPYRRAAPQGLPNKLFEYMAHGVFQVSTLQGEAAELLGALRAGYTVESDNADALASGIAEGLKHASRPDTRERIRKQFRKHYDADTVYTELAERIEGLETSRALGSLYPVGK